MDQIAAMRAFRRVVETGGFSAAAMALNQSHTIVSRQIKQLESMLGVQLFNRTTRRIGLTEAGYAYYQRCQHILDQIEEAALAVSQHQTRPIGVLRVNTAMVYGSLELGKWLPRFVDEYPNIHIDLVCNDRFVDLIDEGFDVGLRLTRSLPDSSLIARRLAASEVVLVASPSYLEHRGIPSHPDELARHDHLSYTLTSQPNELRLVRHGGDQSIVNLTSRLTANAPLALRDAAIGGVGIAAFDLFIVHDALIKGSLVRILPDWAQAPRELYAIYPQNRHLTPKVRAFVDFVADYYQNSPWA